jgi:hypothetical protein
MKSFEKEFNSFPIYSLSFGWNYIKNGLKDKKREVFAYPLTNFCILSLLQAFNQSF